MSWLCSIFSEQASLCIPCMLHSDLYLELTRHAFGLTGEATKKKRNKSKLHNNTTEGAPPQLLLQQATVAPAAAGMFFFCFKTSLQACMYLAPSNSTREAFGIGHYCQTQPRCCLGAKIASLVMRYSILESEFQICLCYNSNLSSLHLSLPESADLNRSLFFVGAGLVPTQLAAVKTHPETTDADGQAGSPTSEPGSPCTGLKDGKKGRPAGVAGRGRGGRRGRGRPPNPGRAYC